MEKEGINYLAASGRGIAAKRFSYISLQAAGNITPRSRPSVRDQFDLIILTRLRLLKL
jgi:hypothetical protein